MYRLFNFIIWILIIIGVGALLMDMKGEQKVIFSIYMTLLELYLLGVSAFFVLKRVAFYRLRGEVDIIRLTQKSKYQNSLMWHGIILGLLGLVYISLYTYFMSFNSLILGLLFLYYIVQVLLNGRPTIYISDKKFAYDDYFIDEWDWQEVSRVELQENKMRLIGSDKDFELNYELIDEIDYRNLSEEVEMAVLDGEFSKGKSSKDLEDIVRSYANTYGVQLIKNNS
ncbi:MAG: hypothetical protein AAGG75_19620 [Bacteroidota bacterium]